jgi:hypothetical protein
MMVLLLISFVAAGCAKTVEFVPPPLQAPPELTSIVPDKNDRTGEKGYWMNRGDAEGLGGFFGHVNNVRGSWK